MLCEMCGRDVDGLVRVRVEGSVLRLCENCRRFGTVLDPPTPAPASLPRVVPAGGGGAAVAPPRATGRRRTEERDLFSELPDMELAPDWSHRIRVAREKLAWTPEDLGKKLNEKKSVILKMEAGAFRPPDLLIPKIEHLLKIRLKADPTAAE